MKTQIYTQPQNSDWVRLKKQQGAVFFQKEKVPMAIPKEIFARSTLIILAGTKLFNNVSNPVGNY